jgi:hypothetical protein
LILHSKLYASETYKDFVDHLQDSTSYVMKKQDLFSHFLRYCHTAQEISSSSQTLQNKFPKAKVKMQSVTFWKVEFKTTWIAADSSLYLATNLPIGSQALVQPSSDLEVLDVMYYL